MAQSLAAGGQSPRPLADEPAPAEQPAPAGRLFADAPAEEPAPAPAPAPAAETPAPAAETPAPAPAPEAPKPAPAPADPLADSNNASFDTLVSQADAAAKAGDNVAAADLYRRAIAIKDEAGVRGKLAEVEAKTSRATKDRAEAQTGLDNSVQQFNVLHNETCSKYDAAMDKADKQLKALNFRAAEDAVLDARMAINAGRPYLTGAEYDAKLAAAEAKAAEIDKVRLAKVKENEELRIRQAEQAKLDTERQLLEEKRRRVASLLSGAREMQRNGQSDKALQAAEQAVREDPLNDTARYMADFLRDETMMRRAGDYAKQRSIYQAQFAIEGREALIPYSDLITYPTDWPELSHRRQSQLAGSFKESDSDRNARLLLNDRTLDATYNGEALQKVIQDVRDATGANIMVSWTALETAVGISRERPVTLQLRRISAADLLRYVLKEVSAEADPQNRVTYAIDHGTIVIDTVRNLNGLTTQHVYDIKDLLSNPPSFESAPTFNLSQALSNTNTGGGGGGGSQSPFTAGQEEEPVDPQEVIDQLTDLIKNSVGNRAEWDDGSTSSMSVLNGNLIVKTTPENHRDLIRLLAEFRETRSVQISVESRFLVVESNFLEEIGVDLDVTLPANGGRSPIVINNNTAPSQVNGGSGMAARPTSSLTPGAWVTGATGMPSAATLGVSFINDIQVDLLVTATQARRTGVTLTAPRVTFFNGQRAYVMVARQISFVSDLVPIPGAAGFDPTLSITQSGAILDIEGAVSADRRYVTLTLRPSMATVRDPIRQVPQSGVVNVGGGGQGGGQNVNVTAAVEAPELELIELRTTVSIPDRGTLLTGGQRLVTETEIEAGVPVLSKIPLIDRLFTNTSKVKDERTLLILVKPTILLQMEEEEMRWPGGMQDWGAFNTQAVPVQQR